MCNWHRRRGKELHRRRVLGGHKGSIEYWMGEKMIFTFFEDLGLGVFGVAD